MVSKHVQPGTLEGVSLNVVDYEAIRYKFMQILLSIVACVPGVRIV